MKQATFHLTESQIEFLDGHAAMGFSDESALVRAALDEFRRRLRAQRLDESARLYAEVYEEDADLRSLTDGALEDWPE